MLKKQKKSAELVMMGISLFLPGMAEEADAIAVAIVATFLRK
jgi:hypothetical protein